MEETETRSRHRFSLFRNQLPAGSNSSRGTSWECTRPRCTRAEGRSSAVSARRSCSTGSRCAITSWCTRTWSRSSARSARRDSSGRAASGRTWSFTQPTRRSSATSAQPSSRDLPCWRPTSWRTQGWEGSSATYASTASIWRALSNITFCPITVRFSSRFSYFETSSSFFKWYFFIMRKFPATPFIIFCSTYVADIFKKRLRLIGQRKKYLQIHLKGWAMDLLDYRRERLACQRRN